MADSTTPRSLQRAEEYIAKYRACCKLYQSGKLEECADAVKHYLKTIDHDSSLSFLILLAGCSVDDEAAIALHQANTLWSSSRACYAHGQDEEVEIALIMTRLLLDTTKSLHRMTASVSAATDSDHGVGHQNTSERNQNNPGDHDISHLMVESVGAINEVTLRHLTTDKEAETRAQKLSSGMTIAAVLESCVLPHTVKGHQIKPKAANGNDPSTTDKNGVAIGAPKGTQTGLEEVKTPQSPGSVPSRSSAPTAAQGKPRVDCTMTAAHDSAQKLLSITTNVLASIMGKPHENLLEGLPSEAATMTRAGDERRELADSVLCETRQLIEEHEQLQQKRFVLLTEQEQVIKRQGQNLAKQKQCVPEQIQLRKQLLHIIERKERNLDRREEVLDQQNSHRTTQRPLLLERDDLLKEEQVLHAKRLDLAQRWDELEAQYTQLEEQRLPRAERLEELKRRSISILQQVAIKLLRAMHIVFEECKLGNPEVAEK